MYAAYIHTRTIIEESFISHYFFLVINSVICDAKKVGGYEKVLASYDANSWPNLILSRP